MTGMQSVARQCGSLIGLAIGDAIGVVVEVERAGMQPWNPQTPTREGRHGRRVRSV